MRVLLTGASGLLGSCVADRLEREGYDWVGWSGSTRGERAGRPLVPVPLDDRSAIAEALDRADPAVVLHLGAITRVDQAFQAPERARWINVEATATLANWAQARGRRLVFTSTDLVFDGSRAPYRESDPTRPLLEYARTKAEAERSVVPAGLVVRLPTMFGASRSGTPSGWETTIEALRRGEPRTFFEDEFRSPIDLETAAWALVRLAGSPILGILHVAGPERVSRFDLVRRFARALGIDPRTVLGNRQGDNPGPEPRPADVSLDTGKLRSLWPDWSPPTIEEAAASWAAKSTESLGSAGPFDR